MEMLLRKGNSGSVDQLYGIQVFETPSQPIHPDMQLGFWTNTNPSLNLPNEYHHSKVSMIILFFSYLVSSHPIFACITIHLRKKMK
jgi:hypothetical protein